MDEQELAAIEARATAATPPPWQVERTLSGTMHRVIGATAYKGGGLFLTPRITAHSQAQANVEFLLHAREDVPALVAEVRRLRAILKHTDLAALM